MYRLIFVGATIWTALALRPDLIHGFATPARAAVLRQTHDIPVVFSVLFDAVASGFVTKISRPGGNVTAFSVFDASLAGKLSELLKEIAPQVSRLSMLFNPGTARYRSKHSQSPEPASTAPDISNQTNRKTIIAFSARHSVPAVYAFRFFIFIEN